VTDVRGSWLNKTECEDGSRWARSACRICAVPQRGAHHPHPAGTWPWRHQPAWRRRRLFVRWATDVSANDRRDDICRLRCCVNSHSVIAAVTILIIIRSSCRSSKRRQPGGRDDIIRLTDCSIATYYEVSVRSTKTGFIPVALSTVNLLVTLKRWARRVGDWIRATTVAMSASVCLRHCLAQLHSYQPRRQPHRLWFVPLADNFTLSLNLITTQVRG